MSPPPANPYTQTKGKGYRVLTRNNPNLRNRTLVSKNNIPPPPPPPPIALPHAILNSQHFDALDADDDGLLSMQEFVQPITFDLIKAAELMRLSNFAYDQYEHFNNTPNNDWQIPAPFNQVYTNPLVVIRAVYEQPSIPLGFITHNHANNEIYISWRGTSNMTEWIVDVKIDKVACSFLPLPPGKNEQNELVHLGFHELYVTGNAQSPNKSPRNTVIDYLKGLTNKQDKIVHVTGHSLGGALAVLNVCDILANVPGFKSVRMFNFAGPAVGDWDFAKTFNAKTLINGIAGSWRIVNVNDKVPQEPPSSAGFVHVKDVHMIEFGDKLSILHPSGLATNHSSLTYFRTLVKEMRDNGISATVLKNRGFTSSELKSVTSGDGGYTTSELQKAGFINI
jgi:hypothetical protein